MATPNPRKVGIRVVCVICHTMKQPHGRSAPMDSYYCDSDCRGYDLAPLPGCLWPGETAEDFGYQSCDNATEIVDNERGEASEATQEGI